MSREKKETSADSIKTYKSIPGVTAEEITVIEALKADRKKFSLGVLIGEEMLPLPDGSYDGFLVRLSRFLTDFLEIPVVAEIYEWDALVERLEARSVDFTEELTATEERMKKYSMSLPIAERMLRIFTLKDSNDIQTEEDVVGRTIGFLEGTITADDVERVYHIPFKKVEVANYPMAAQMLQRGEIDGFIEEAVALPAFEQYDFIRSRIIFPLIHSPVSIMTANPELTPVISIIDKYIATEEGSRKLVELYEEGERIYARNELSKLLTEEEKAYIEDLVQRKATVPIAFEFDDYPVNFYNKNEKEFQGIAIDVLAEISKLLDIKFEVVNVRTVWAEIYEKTKTGEIPMTTRLLRTKPREEHFIWSETPYSHSYYAVMSKSNFPNLLSHQVARYSVGVMKQSGYEDVYNELFPYNRNLKRYDTLSACLSALEKGEVDLLMASEHVLLTQLHYLEKPQFKINLRLSKPMSSCFGFNKNEKVLCSVISKAQQFVQTDVIENHWMNRTYDYSKKLAENQRFFISIFACVVSLMLVAAVSLLLRNIKLSRKLKVLASNDALTDVYNRRYFLELGNLQMKKSLRTGQQCFVVIYDLDHFKAINDKYGHLAGDTVLKEVTRRVKVAIRPYDLYGRYGGEEFILLMTDVDKTDLLNFIERLRQNICREPVLFGDVLIPVSASFGIYSTSPSTNMDTAIKLADEALYQAKARGRNRIVFYNENNGEDIRCNLPWT
ncbi:MAG: diguanylate cyclase [Planctomycetaceae bacterium]|nr:diguanylate cyclase [Planctomycetaceae bacterium]